MAVAAIGPALSALGGLVGMFGSDKMKRTFWAPEFQDYITDQEANLRQDEALTENQLRAYKKAQDQRIKDYNALRKQGMQEYGSIYQQLQGQGLDPGSIEGGLRQSRLADFYKFANMFPTALSKAQKLTNAALNWGGRGGSALSAQNWANVNNALTPLFGSIMSGITPAAGAIQAGRLGNIGGLTNIINARNLIPGLGEGLELSAPTATIGLRQGLLGNLGNTLDLAKANVWGMSKDSNWADKVGGGLQAVGGAMSPLGGGGGFGGGSFRPMIDAIGGIIKKNRENETPSGGQFGGGSAWG